MPTCEYSCSCDELNAPNDCLKCCCQIESKLPVCEVDLDCALKVKAHVYPGLVGDIKIYVIDIVLKNCTNKVFEYACAQLDLGCAAFILSTSLCGQQTSQHLCDNSDCTCVIGLDEICEDDRELSIKTCVEGGSLPVNKYWNGVDKNSNIHPGCDRTQLFRQPDTGAPGPNVLFPPGESRLKVRIIANKGDLYLIKPVLSVGANVPCCGPVRVSQFVDTDDCMPNCYSVESCPPSLGSRECLCSPKPGVVA